MQNYKRTPVAQIRCGSRLSVLLVLASLLLALSIAMAYRRDKTSNELQEEAAKLVGPLYDLGGRLLTEMNKRDGRKNVIMSPISIHQALSMVLLGADLNTETRRELLDAVGYKNYGEAEVRACDGAYTKVMDKFKNITDDTLAKRRDYEASKDTLNEWDLARNQPRSSIVDMFTMMVTKNKAEPLAKYAADIKKYYHSSLANIDDQKPETKKRLLEQVNGWAKEAGFDEDLLTEQYLADNFEAILLSAIRVEAFWPEEFNEYEHDKVFYNYGAKDKPVKGTALSVSDLHGARFLAFDGNHSSDGVFTKLSGFNFRAIELPLRDGLTFVILDPLEKAGDEQSAMSELNKLAENLFADCQEEAAPKKRVKHLAKALELLDSDMARPSIQFIRMPKFKFDSDIDLKPALQSMGLRRAFDRQNAQISNITTNKVYIDDIKHEAVIEATKSGIKAAGLTAVKIAQLSATWHRRPIKVDIENPFLFVVRYEKLPLFVGQLTHL